MAELQLLNWPDDLALPHPQKLGGGGTGVENNVTDGRRKILPVRFSRNK
jgi:hypothetical protein